LPLSYMRARVLHSEAINCRRVKLVIGIVVVIFVVFPVIQGRRMAGNMGLQSATEGIDLYLQPASEGGPDNPAIRALARVSERLHGIESLCIYIQRIPDQIPFEGIRSFSWRVAATFIPRALYPDKPSTSRGMFFNTVVIQLQSYSATGASIAPFQLGDAYSIDGVSMVGIFAFVLGCYARYVSRLRITCQTDAFFPYACMLLLPILSFERDIALVWTSLPKLCLLYVVAYNGCAEVLTSRRAHKPNLRALGLAHQ
jgi:hypothetical protein